MRETCGGLLKTFILLNLTGFRSFLFIMLNFSLDFS